MTFYVVMYGLAALLTLIMLVQRRFVGAAIVWSLIGLGSLVDGAGGDALAAFGVILLALGSVGVTRGQIFAGSPRKKTHGTDPSIYRDDVHQALVPPSDAPVDDVDTQSVHLTHPFWGPE